MAARQQGVEIGRMARPEALPPAAVMRAALAGASLVLGLLAQWALDRRLAPGVAGGASVVAAAALGAVARPWRAPGGGVAAARPAWSSRDGAALASLAVLGAAAFYRFAGNRFSPIALVTWLPG